MQVFYIVCSQTLFKYYAKNINNKYKLINEVNINKILFNFVLFFNIY